MNPWRMIASVAGVGFAPKAPGTFGSLVGLALGALLLLAGDLPLLAGIIVIVTVGLFAIQNIADAGQDPGWIVIDEVAGQMIPLLGLGFVGFWGLALAFGLFRLFDIFKPGPVAWADARHDEWGVMGDDIIAGVLALAVILALRLVLVI